MNAIDANRSHVAWLKAEAAAGRVYGHERELAYYERRIRRHDRACRALCYALLASLTWAVFTHDPRPMLALAVVSLGVAYWPEWVGR